MKISTDAPVLVTGATGYVAGWLVKDLLEAGVTVHAAVRNPDATDKLAHLTRIADETPGSLRFFKADLLQPGSYEEAMKGCAVGLSHRLPLHDRCQGPAKGTDRPGRHGHTKRAGNGSCDAKRETRRGDQFLCRDLHRCHRLREGPWRCSDRKHLEHDGLPRLSALQLFQDAGGEGSLEDRRRPGISSSW